MDNYPVLNENAFCEESVGNELTVETIVLFWRCINKIELN